VIEETARVVRTQGCYAWVQTLARRPCDGCVSRSGCGAGTIAGVLGRRPVQVRAVNGLGVGAGDEVVVGLSEGALLAGSLALYLVPLAAFLSASMLGGWMAERWGFGGADLWSIAAGLLGLAMGLVWTRRFGSRAAADLRYAPVILRRANG
jgi:sigma-E factor negative regulatory protein RseC